MEKLTFFAVGAKTAWKSCCFSPMVEKTVWKNCCFLPMEEKNGNETANFCQRWKKRKLKLLFFANGGRNAWEKYYFLAMYNFFKVQFFSIFTYLVEYTARQWCYFSSMGEYIWNIHTYVYIYYQWWKWKQRYIK